MTSENVTVCPSSHIFPTDISGLVTAAIWKIDSKSRSVCVREVELGLAKVRDGPTISHKELLAAPAARRLLEFVPSAVIQ